MKQQNELRAWLQELTGYSLEELTPASYPVLQALQERLEASEQKIQALLKQKQLFTLLVNGTEDMFVMFSGRDCRVEYVSPNMEFLLGLWLDDVSVSTIPPLIWMCQPWRN